MRVFICFFFISALGFAGDKYTVLVELKDCRVDLYLDGSTPEEKKLIPTECIKIKETSISDITSFVKKTTSPLFLIKPHFYSDDPKTPGRYAKIRYLIDGQTISEFCFSELPRSNQIGGIRGSAQIVAQK
jgi:hypothetical protein